MTDQECNCRYVHEPDVGGWFLAAENPDCPEHGDAVQAQEGQP